MTLSDLSIKNTVFPVMLCAAMIVFGYLGYRELGISQLPEIDFPTVTIRTNWEAASPDIVDGDVTDVIEDAVLGVEGIDYIAAQSVQGSSEVTVFFQLYRDVDSAMQDVQNAVSAAMRRLPPDVDPPSISKINTNRFPIMWLACYGSRPINEINTFVDDHLRQAVQNIPGCGGLYFGGLRSRNMRIWLDSRKLSSFGLDVRDIQRALRREHIEQPAGYLESQSIEINVRTLGEGRTREDFERMIVTHHGDRLVRLSDVAVIEDGLADKRSFARFNGVRNVGVGILRAQGSNVVEVCDAVRARLPQLQKMLPEGMNLGISVDYSSFIKDDVEELKTTLWHGVVLTALVAFMFLGSLGPTINICLSIPTSLMGTFFIMRMSGFTINFMTLLALSLSVGVVVDDAILVLENIYRRREEGEKALPAALAGANEISFAAIAATISIIAIFLPVAFLEGAIGRYFFEFGITVSVAVFLSLITSLTLTPMLCAYFLSVRQSPPPAPRSFRGWIAPPINLIRWCFWILDRWLLEPLLVVPTNWIVGTCGWLYRHAIAWSLRFSWLVLLLSLGVVSLTGLFLFGINLTLPAYAPSWLPRTIEVAPLGRELIPSEDQSRFMVNIIAPVGCSIEYMEETITRCEARVKDMPELASLYCAISSRGANVISEAVMFCRLVEREKRQKTQAQLIAEVRERLKPVAGMRFVVMDLSTQGFTAVRGFPVNFAVQGPDWKKVTEYSQIIMRRMQESGLVTDVNSDYRPGMPEVQIYPRREKAAQAGVPIESLALTINAMIGGMRVGRYTSDGKRYDVRVRLMRDQRSTPDQIPNIYLRSNTGTLVPVAELIDMVQVPTLPMVTRYNHARKVEITANMALGVSQGAALEGCREIAAGVLSPGYRLVPLGNAKAMQTTLDSLTYSLALGIIVAYMVLGVQFNSFVHPFAVLLAMPFAVSGALATLWYTGDTLNLMSMIGLVLLMGLVKKNSIILVDAINHQRSLGLSVEEAVLVACPMRLRPILMTTFATIVGAIPLAVGWGAGAETRAPLARGIIGGISVSTLVTLVIVPVFYLLLERVKSWVARWTRPARLEARPASSSIPLPVAGPAHTP